MRNWAGNVRYATDCVIRPTTVEELQAVVCAANRVRATGTRHSFSRVVDTDGVLVTTAGLDLAIEIDECSKIAWVPGGATYAQVAPVLQASGHALHNMASLPHISVAGACATGTHGSGVQNGCLASQVVGVEMVTGTGEFVRAGNTDPDFAGVVISLGSLGVVTRLAVSLDRSYQVRQEVLLGVSMASAVENAADILSAAYSVSLFLSFKNRSVVDSVWLKHREHPGCRSLELETLWGGRQAPAKVHPIVGLDAQAATDQLGSSGPWHERLPHFNPAFTPSAGDEIQSEFFVPREAVSDVLSALAHRSPEFDYALQVMEIRAVAADDLWLSPFQGRETVAVHATWVSDVRLVRSALLQLESILKRFAPRPHWGKLFLGFDRVFVEDAYPDLPRFRALANRLDPEHRFVNDFVSNLGIRDPVDS